MRIKRMESVEDKFRRHPDKYGTDWDPARFRTMDDALGVRVIVYFLSDFTLVHNELHSLADDIEVLGDPPTTAYLPAGLPERLNLGLVDRKDKTSGYASLHYRCRLRRSEVPLEQRPLFEIQVRTLAEHTWAEIHHLIGYKREKETSVEVEEETRIISSHLKVIDEHFDLLRLRLGRAQMNAPKPKGKTKLNAENLPVILGELNLLADQREVDGLLRSLASRGIRQVKDLRDRATPHRLDLIRKEWQQLTGRPAQTFDVTGVLGTISPTASNDEVRAKVKEWAAVANRWRRRRDDEQLDRTLRALRHHGVTEAADIERRASTSRIQIIRAAWKDTCGSAPTSFQVLTVFSLLDGSSSDDQVQVCTQALAELIRSSDGEVAVTPQS
jgi:ppGpp synthetase/RelA/SpoT-type nucleotidyltranferase